MSIDAGEWADGAGGVCGSCFLINSVFLVKKQGHQLKVSTREDVWGF